MHVLEYLAFVVTNVFMLSGMQQFTLRVAIDVAKGMHFLHTATPPILHRRLRSTNVLVCSLSLLSIFSLSLSCCVYHFMRL
jgi:hypothetical protein